MDRQTLGSALHGPREAERARPSRKPLMPAALSPSVILVLGMHRSGTSAVTRLVNMLGADVGQDLLPPQADNPTGHWENAALVDLHRRVMEALGLSGWSDPTPLPEGWGDDDRLEPFRAELADILGESLDPERAWVIKDPRLCRLLPLWWPVLRALGREPLCVFVTRPAVEVAASLAARDGLDAALVHHLWLRYVLDAERDSRACARHVVSFESVLKKPGELLRRVAKLTGLGPAKLPAALIEEARAFLQPALRHHAAAELPQPAALERLGWTKAVEAALAALESSDTPAARRKFTGVRTQLDDAAWLLAEASGERRDESEERAPQAVEGADAAEQPESIDAVYAAVPRWDHGQLDSRSITKELYDDDELSFELSPRHPNFCALELLVGTFGRTNTCQLEIELHTLVSTESGERVLGELVVRHTVEARRLTDNAWHRVNFLPQAESEGHDYRLVVRSPGAEPGDAVTFYASEQGEPAYRAYYATLVESELALPGEDAVSSHTPGAGAIAALQARVSDLATRLASAQDRIERADAFAGETRAGAQLGRGELANELTRLRQQAEAQREELREQLSSALRREIAESLRAELSHEIGEALRPQLAESLRREVAEVLRPELREELAALGASDAATRLEQALASVTETEARVVAELETAAQDAARADAAIKAEMSEQLASVARTNREALEARITTGERELLAGLSERLDGLADRVVAGEASAAEAAGRQAGALDALRAEQAQRFDEQRADRGQQLAALRASLQEANAALEAKATADTEALAQRLDDERDRREVSWLELREEASRRVEALSTRVDRLVEQQSELGGLVSRVDARVGELARDHAELEDVGAESRRVREQLEALVDEWRTSVDRQLRDRDAAADALSARVDDLAREHDTLDHKLDALDSQDHVQHDALRNARDEIDRLFARCDGLRASLGDVEVRTHEAFEILSEALESEVSG